MYLWVDQDSTFCQSHLTRTGSKDRHTQDVVVRESMCGDELNFDKAECVSLWRGLEVNGHAQ